MMNRLRNHVSLRIYMVRRRMWLITHLQNDPKVHCFQKLHGRYWRCSCGSVFPNFWTERVK